MICLFQLDKIKVVKKTRNHKSPCIIFHDSKK